MKKRIIALLLAVMMLVSLMPTMAFADDDPAAVGDGAVQEVSPVTDGDSDSDFDCDNDCDCDSDADCDDDPDYYSIANIILEPISVVEGTNCSKICGEDWNEELGIWEIKSKFYEYRIYNDYPVTVQFKDGSSINCRYDEFCDNYWVSTFSDQSLENQWGVGEHQFTIRVEGKDYTLDYTITENPILSIDFDDVTVIENTNGYWDYSVIWDSDLGDYIETDKYFHYNLGYDSTGTVYYKDGSVSECTISELDDEGNVFRISNQSYSNQWGVGEHQYTVEVYAKEYTLNYTIIGVENIVFEDLTVPEGRNGGMGRRMTWDEEQGEWVWSPEYFSYDLDGAYTGSSLVTVYYNDGSSETCSLSDFLRSYDCYWSSDQSYINQWGAGEHQFTVTFAGKEYTLNFTVTESPVADIVFEDVTVMEGKNCWEDYDEYWDEELGEWVRSNKYKRYNINWGSNVTICYKDGSSETLSLSEFSDQFELNYTTDQSYDNQWGVGEHQITFNVAGKVYTQKYIITESPIADVVFDPVSFIEGCNGYINSDYIWDEESKDYIVSPKYYYYNIHYMDAYATVYFKDGSSETYSYWDLYAQFDANDFSDQSYENQWGVGKHQFIVEICGKQYTLDVTITESPIADIVFEPITVYEFTHGYYDYTSRWDEELEQEIISDKYFCYSAETWNINATVYYKDGSTKTCGLTDLPHGMYMGFSSDQSYENQWGVGKHQFVITVYGKEYTLDYIVVENPIKEIKFPDLTLVENTNGYFSTGTDWDDDLGKWVESYRYYYYNVLDSLWNNKVTVDYKDGSSAECYMYELFNQDISISVDTDQSELNPWGLGKHTATISYLDKTVDISVNIRKTPIKSIKVAPVVLYEGEGMVQVRDDDFQEYWYNKYLDYYPKEITIEFADGSVFTGNADQLRAIVGCGYEITDDQSLDAPWGLGKHKATLNFLNVSADFEVNIVESNVESIEVSDMTIPEYTGGWNRYEGVYYYDLFNTPVKINYKDGTSEVFANLDIASNLTGHNFNAVSGYDPETGTTAYPQQHYDESWAVGTYKACVEYCGVKGEYNVNIVENPVVSISVPSQPVHFKDGRNLAYGSLNSDENGTVHVFGYEVHPAKLTVNYKDGSSKTYAWDEVYEKTGYSPGSICEVAYPKAGPADGVITSYVSYLGASCDFNTVRDENDVVSVTAKDVTIPANKNCDTTFRYDLEKDIGYTECSYYGFEPTEVTVKYKDGHSEKLSSEDFYRLYEENGSIFFAYAENGLFSQAWDIGTHKASFFYLGKTGTYNVTVGDCTHSRTETVNAKAASCTNEGYTGDVVCIDCGEVITTGKTISALGHNYKDGKCTRCFGKDPNYVVAPTVKLSNVASTGKIKLSWGKVDNAVKYEVYRATSKTGTYSKLGSTTGTSYTNKSATAGKTYYYKVRAIAPNGTVGAFSAILSRTCDCAQPVLKLTNVASSGKIKVSWDKIDGASKYEVYRATSKTGTYSKLTTVTGTSYTDSKATAGKTYYYKVMAICKATTSGNSVYSDILSRTCDLAQPVVKLTNVASSGKIKVSWGKIDGASKYEVYRATSKTGTYSKLTTTTSTSYTDSKATAAKTYYYKVKAICKATTSANSAYSDILSRTCDLAQPTVKLTLTSHHPKVSWAKITGATKYEVYRATSKTGTYSKVTTVTGTSYTDKKAKTGKTYYYKVKAVCGTSAAAGAYSAVKSIKVK